MFELSNTAETLLVDNDGVIKPYTDEQANELFQKLRDWRLGEASKIALPAYCVLDDKTLKYITDIMPTSLQTLWIVPGMKRIKIANYGNEIIKIVQNFLTKYSVSNVLIGKNALSITKHNEAIIGFLGLTDYFNNLQKANEDSEEQPLNDNIANEECIEYGNDNIPQPIEPDQNSYNTCKNCMEMKSGNCFGQSEICEDFKFSPTITEKQKANWPKYGDVTAFKKGERR